MGTQVQNLTSAEDAITAADIASDVSNMSKYNILEQTGMAASGPGQFPPSRVCSSCCSNRSLTRGKGPTRSPPP